MRRKKDLCTARASQTRGEFRENFDRVFFKTAFSDFVLYIEIAQIMLLLSLRAQNVRKSIFFS